MEAMVRYTGHFYQTLEQNIREFLVQGQIDNVYVVSALMGLLQPSDKIPDYELMMNDRSTDNGTVKKYWAQSLGHDDFCQAFEQNCPNLEYAYCFLSRWTGYLDAVRPLLKTYEAFYIDTRRRGLVTVERIWGQGLNTCLHRRLETPEEMELALTSIGCRVVRL